MVEEEYQLTPDLAMAIKNEHEWGHLRLLYILRSIRYSLDGDSDSFFGYGLALSGIYKHQ